jgi:DNA-binding CsgD family transcriptional regulator
MAGVSPLAVFARTAAGATNLAEYRAQVLVQLGRLVRFDAALMHALSPRVPLQTAAVQGIDPRVLARSARRWDELADILSPLQQIANQHLVATDAEALPARSRARRRLDDLVLRPFGQRSLCIMHLVVQGRVVAAVVLMARRIKAFSRIEVARLRQVAPLIAVGDALHQRLSAAPAASVATRLACVDQRLSPRQRQIVEHVALGHSNREIASALGLSPHSVRNHLVRIFEATGAANRADVVRRAVLLPSR